MSLPLLALLAAACVGHAAAGPRVLLADSAQASYLRHSDAQTRRWSSDDLQSLTSGLLGVRPGSPVSDGSSSLAATLLQPSLFKKPKCHAMFTVAGLGDLSSLFAGRQQHTAELRDSVDFVTTELLAGLVQSNPDISLLTVDQAAIQTCTRTDCLAQLLPAVAKALGGQHTGDVLVLPGGQLDLTSEPDRLFASELASVLTGLRSISGNDESQDLQLVEVTLLGLQALQAAYGAESQQASAGQAALQQMLQWAVAQLDASFGGDTTYQVVTLDALPGDDQSLNSAITWRERSRRRLQAVGGSAAVPVAAGASTAYPGPDENARARQFTAKAAGYGAFILLVYFLLAGIWTLCNMPMVHDTLLFGSGKKQA